MDTFDEAFDEMKLYQREDHLSSCALYGAVSELLAMRQRRTERECITDAKQRAEQWFTTDAGSEIYKREVKRLVEDEQHRLTADNKDSTQQTKHQIMRVPLSHVEIEYRAREAILAARARSYANENGGVGMADLVRASDLLVKSWELQEANYGREHVTCGMACSALAHVSLARGEGAEARQYLDMARGVYAACFSSDEQGGGGEGGVPALAVVHAEIARLQRRSNEHSAAAESFASAARYYTHRIQSELQARGCASRAGNRAQALWLESAESFHAAGNSAEQCSALGFAARAISLAFGSESVVYAKALQVHGAAVAEAGEGGSAELMTAYQILAAHFGDKDGRARKAAKAARNAQAGERFKPVHVR
jgi:hypothetical protein